MNDLKYKFKSVFFFVLTFAFGYSLFFGYIQDRFIARDPAAIGSKIHQLKNIDPDEIKSELASEIQIQTISEGDKVIRFKSFSSNVCKHYPNVQIQFFADGVTVAGEAPTMTIDASCLPAQDPAEMASIEIPVSKILKLKPANAEVKFDGLTSKFIFKSTADEWPKTWILKAVVFKGPTGATKAISFDHKISPHSEPTVLEF